MDDLEGKINAWELKGTVDDSVFNDSLNNSVPPIALQPGMKVTYEQRTNQVSEFYSFNYEPGEHLKNLAYWIYEQAVKVFGRKGQFEGVVSKIEYQNGEWNVFLQGVSSPFRPLQLEAFGQAAVPQVESGETTEIIVEDKMGKIEKINARVITQSEIADDPLVYLTNITGTAVYAARLSGLSAHKRSLPIVIPSDTNNQRTPLPADPPIQPATQSSQGSSAASQIANAQAATALVSPSDLYQRISAVVIDQEPAIKSLSVAIYDHCVRPDIVKKGNVLIIGPTGTGKTESARTASELVGLPFGEIKLAGVSSTGYKGTNLEQLFEDLYRHSSHQYFSRAIAFLDEIDKLTERHFSQGGFGSALQNELISWVESAKLKVGADPNAIIDTTGMLFIAAGAFVGIEDVIANRVGTNLDRYSSEDRRKAIIELYEQLRPDDLIVFGMKPELVGRFPIITYTKPLTAEILIEIMKKGAKSPINQQLLLLRQGYQVDVSVEDEAYRVLADAAISRGTGARGIEAVSSKLFENVKYDLGKLTQGRTNLIITPEIALRELRDSLPKGYKI